MRRQLRATGGITNARQGYGLGSWVKERIRKLIPNELASIASKAAPFVAPFNPGIAGLMRGIGRFDERGSMSDALKQGLLTTGLGAGARYLGGAEQVMGGGLEGGFTSPLSESRTEGFRNLFRGSGETEAPSKGLQKSTYGADQDLLGGDKIIPGVDVPIPTGDFSLKGIMDKWNSIPPGMQTAIVGVGSGTLAGLAQWFENQIPQEEGEDITAYLARRKVAVGKLMREYMDSTRAYEAEWTSMTDEEKNEEVANLNYNQGGRVGYQTGGISMGNTLAQNIAANQAQAAKVNQMLQAARSKLPGAAAQAPSGITTVPTSQAQTMVAPSAGATAVPGGGGPMTASPTAVPQPMAAPTAAPQPMAAPPNIQYLSGSMAPPLAPPDPFKQFGVTPDQYAQMSPGDQDKLWKKIDYIDQYGGELGTTYKILQERGIDPSKYITGTSPVGSPTYNRLGIMEAKLRSDIDELYGDWKGHGKTITGQETFDELLDLEDYYTKNYVWPYKSGGRVGYAIGSPEKQMEAGAPPIIYEGNMDPRAQNQQAGLPSIPGPMRMARDGPEFDMRQRGGFQPLGRQEGRDDVPAMLAKNEFVMTADAVRAAGGGSINKGAQRMYDTMKNLERRVS